MLLWRLTLAFLLITFQIVCINTNNAPVVEIRQGKLKGAVLKSYNGRDYHAFRGIPYGKPTSGLLRFKPPVPVDPWEGILDATKQGLECPQINVATRMLTGSENCLFLNVYVPQGLDNTKPLPVLVYIHGGGFVMGSGAFKYYGPQKFMDQDAVLVTLNYRLGIFGFLNTEDSVSPGNYGMLDQVLALKWVKENAASFGGDPNMVTIFGESAGGASVVYHLLSPLSKGLFQAAIAQSGTPLNPWAFQERPLIWAQYLAAEVKCPVDNTRALFDCLQQREAAHLIDGHRRLTKVNMILPFWAAPAIEGPGGEGFLTQDPLTLMKEGKIANKVPFIAGLLPDEGYMFYSMVKTETKNEGQKLFDEDLNKFVYISYDTEPESDVVTDSVKRIYFSDKDIANNTNLITSQLIKMLSDCLFAAGISKTVNFFADANVPTLLYVYNYTAEHSIATFSGGVSGKYISHGDELLLQFSIAASKLNEKDKKMSDLINSLWVTIASGEAPVISVGDKTVEWELYDSKDRLYLNLNLNSELKSGIVFENADFWVETVPHLFKTLQTKDEL